MQSSPKDRFRTLAFSKGLYLLVQTLLSCLLGHIPNTAVCGSLQAWVGAAGFCQLRACAHAPQGMQGPSPPSSFILPIHCSALFNHRDDAGIVSCLPRNVSWDWKRFISIFLKEILVLNNFSFIKSK